MLRMENSFSCLDHFRYIKSLERCEFIAYTKSGGTGQSEVLPDDGKGMEERVCTNKFHEKIELNNIKINGSKLGQILTSCWL